MSLELLVSNLGSVRRETLDGREYLVAPATLIVEGVLNGSKGPLFYPMEEIQRNHSAWNGMPLVVNHPKDQDGLPVTARRPDILEKYGVGHVFNAQVNGKLTAEAWFDVKKTQKIEPRIYRALRANKPIELSTGLFTRQEPVSNGDFNGSPYVAVARDYQPDHLAILPDSLGACSLRDGCGVLNEEGKDCGCGCGGAGTCKKKKKKTLDKFLNNAKGGGGANCGIGPGGFQPGNKCAAGGGAAQGGSTIGSKQDFMAAVSQILAGKAVAEDFKPAGAAAGVPQHYVQKKLKEQVVSKGGVNPGKWTGPTDSANLRDTALKSMGVKGTSHKQHLQKATFGGSQVKYSDDMGSKSKRVSSNDPALFDQAEKYAKAKGFTKVSGVKADKAFHRKQYIDPHQNQIDITKSKKYGTVSVSFTGGKVNTNKIKVSTDIGPKAKKASSALKTSGSVKDIMARPSAAAKKFSADVKKAASGGKVPSSGKNVSSKLFKHAVSKQKAAAKATKTAKAPAAKTSSSSKSPAGFKKIASKVSGLEMKKIEGLNPGGPKKGILQVPKSLKADQVAHIEKTLGVKVVKVKASLKGLTKNEILHLFLRAA